MQLLKKIDAFGCKSIIEPFSKVFVRIKALARKMQTSSSWMTNEPVALKAPDGICGTELSSIKIILHCFL